MEEFAWALATAVGKSAAGPKQGENHDIYKWAGLIGDDLLRNKGACVVIAGEHQPPHGACLGARHQSHLGNVGKTVFYTDPIEANPVDQVASLQDLVKDLDAKAVDLLLILGGNPVFTAPVEMGMRDRIQQARMRIHLSLYEDETSAVCQWSLPEAHFLETWGDARAFDGTVSIQQPLIQPLYEGRSAYEMLQSFTGAPDMRRLRHCQRLLADAAPGARISKPGGGASVHDGVVAGYGASGENTGASNEAAVREKPIQRKLGGTFEVNFRPDPTIYDGRFANNGWLQELPKPITKITWDNAAIMSPGDAFRLGVKTAGDGPT